MLTERGKQVRRDTLTLSSAHGGYHYGGCFSSVEILTTLFDRVLQFAYDEFILSKGHACWPYYVLLREQGLEPRLEGHPVRDPRNGIPATTGSLGHGLPMGIGMAMAKRQKQEKGTVWVLMGDGECQTGTTWESLLIGGRHHLNNLVVIVDWNGIQGSARTDDVLPITTGVLNQVATACGWSVHLTAGHNEDHLEKTLRLAATASAPLLIVADTVKGKGVSFMEDNPAWHARWPNPDEYAAAMEELG